MANNSTERLNHVFAALGDPTRRAMLSRLAREQAVSVSDLAEPFVIKLPSVMKHLDVLSEAGLVRRTKTGRTVMVEISPKPLQTVMDWLERQERYWSTRMDRIAAYAERKEREAQEKGE